MVAGQKHRESMSPLAKPRGSITDFLQRLWLPLLVLLVAAALGGCLLLLRRRHQRWSFSLVLGGAALVIIGVGGLGLVSAELVMWLAAGAAALLFLMVLVVFVTGQWWAPGGYLAGAVLLFGIGGWLLEPVGSSLQTAARFLLSVEPVEPLWLLLLLGLPFMAWFSFRSMSGLGPVRRWVAIGLRCLTLALLVLALAEVHARRPDDSLTVLFVWDRSLSVPPDYGEAKANVDLREERLKQFINEAVTKRGPGKEKDRTGVILFGRRPRLELPPASVGKLYINKFQSPIDDTYTDIASALKLALASFPEGSAKRIVLFSDGNENIGQAEEQARIAKENGVEIDVVPLAAGQRNPNEVLVERIEAPPATEKDTRLPLRIVLRSFHPELVVGSLHLYKKSLDMIRDQPAGDEPPLFTAQVKLRTGLNVFFYQQPGSKKEDTYTYEAKFIPAYVENRNGRKIEDKLAGDRVENNWASVSVMARGQRAILLIEPRVGDHQLLIERLQQAKPSLKIVAVEPRRLPQDPAQLAVVLSKFDAVILANIPAETRDEEKAEIVGLTEEQQKVLRSNTHDQGAGMIVIGGPNSYGAGGWQGTELEKAWPVTSDLKSIKVEGKNGLVLIMHASEMAEGNAWQKKIAKLAFEKLAAIDMVGVLYFDHGLKGGGHRWHIDFQEIGNNRGKLIRDLDSMMPGDMPDADPSLKMARDALSTREYNLGTKHIIFISDGDHWAANPALLAQIKAAKITCTTVCITSHGPGEIKQMALVAGLTGGRSYHVTDPRNLPAIYIKETRLVSKSFVHDKRFTPILTSRGGPTEGLSKDLPDLYGFVRTTRRPSPLVEVPIRHRDKETDFPILAHWQYGLGKTVAFTSDARSLLREKENFWDKDWASSNMYIKFWEQIVDYALRPTETGQFLHLTTEHKDGKVRVAVEANDNDADKTPLTNVDFKVGVSSPSFKGPDGRKVEIKLEQKAAGVYEAEFQADEVGAYFLNVRAEWQKGGKTLVDNVRAGVTIPYSPEFAEMEGNRGLLEKIRETTGGKIYEEDELAKAAAVGDIFRANPHGQQSLQPLWPWLVLLAGVCLFFDVAIRRIALEPAALWARAESLWGALRRQEAAPATTVFLERLQTRKAQVGEALEKQKARRFEGQEGASSAAPEATVAGPASELPKKPTTPAKKAPKEEEPADFATRLMRAKKKAMEDRDK